MRQVAGPHGRTAFAKAKVHVDADVLPFEVAGNRSLVIIGQGLPIARGPGAPEADGEAVAVPP